MKHWKGLRWKNDPRSEKASARSFPMCQRCASGGSPTEVDVDQISPNEHQPRIGFDDARLDELAQSIKANGVIQPIVVRKVDGGYRIIAGERRWRAAQRAGLTRVPVVDQGGRPPEAMRNCSRWR